MSVKILSDTVARKIAAGEVIDRPFSVVRELIDNSIDANAGKILTYIENGGIHGIRVIDNGSGMKKNDLEMCILSHATSKISHEDDLLQVNSLGFRGEALSSIAAVSKYSIKSRTKEMSHGFEISGTIEKNTEISASQCPIGTVVDIRELFYNLPARRHFLKTPAAESGLIKRAIMEKAVCFPQIEFSLFSDNKLSLNLIPSKRLERIQQLYKDLAPNTLWYSIKEEYPDIEVNICGVRPDIYRRDRKYLQIFINNRRVQEYSLQQAIEYAYDSHIPGGTYPIAFVFVNIKPHLVDFNIHPAKKEVRFHDGRSVHHKVVETARKALLDSNKIVIQHSKPDTRYYPKSDSDNFFEFSNQTAPSQPPIAYQNNQTHLEVTDSMTKPYRYFGQLFEVFLLVSKQDIFYLIDMHAGHERLQFDLFKKGNATQKMILPISFEVESAQSEYLYQITSILSDMGIVIQQISQKTWELVGIPPTFAKDPHRLIPFLRGHSGQADQIAVYLYATLACRSAVKEGDKLTSEMAHRIIDGVFALENPKCPHGRPIWIQFSKAHLYKMIGRDLNQSELNIASTSDFLE